MLVDFKDVKIFNLVKDQLPEFYKESGPGLIDFLKAYYQWLEQDQSIIGRQRSLYQQFDIDTATTEFLTHFKKTYMDSLPEDILGNQRLLQKHIIELYQTKGSQSSIRLLFRLLFNEDIDFYIPSYDIFKLSDNEWIQPVYLEVTYTPEINNYVGHPIKGFVSGATAIVERVESKQVNNKLIYILYLSNIIGKFEINELVVCSTVHANNYVTIKGSVQAVDVKSSTPNIPVGTQLISQDSDHPIRIIVDQIYSSALGSLTFTVNDGGSYYSYDTVFDFGTPVSGSGAVIKVGQLSNTFTYTYVTDLLLPYVSVPLSGTYPFPSYPTANALTIIDNCLTHSNTTVGTIDTLNVINPGVGYQNNVAIKATDPHTAGSGILDQNGNYVGLNAVITGIPIVGNNIAKTAYVIDSGFDNLTSLFGVLFKDPATNSTLNADIISSGIGSGVGYFKDTRSMLSSNKYLYDGEYYQNFSYVIRASRTLDTYVDVLKKIVHPAGNAVFGDIITRSVEHLTNDAVYTTVSDDYSENTPSYFSIILQ